MDSDKLCGACWIKTGNTTCSCGFSEQDEKTLLQEMAASANKPKPKRKKKSAKATDKRLLKGYKEVQLRLPL